LGVLLICFFEFPFGRSVYVVFFYFRAVLAHENIFLKRGNLTVMGKLSTPIYAFGGIGKNFNDDYMVQESVGLISRKLYFGTTNFWNMSDTFS